MRGSWARSWLAIAALHALAILLPRSALAIPVFARIYNKPCATCHTVFPQLNPVGEEFRLRGLHGLKPAVEPLHAGDYFEFPGTIPVAIAGSAGEDFNHVHRSNAPDSDIPHFNLQFLSILFGGELSPHLAFFGDWAPIITRTTTGNTDVQTRPGLSFLQAHAEPTHWLTNLRLGLFELPLGTSPRVHRLTARSQLIYGVTAFSLLGRRVPVPGRRDTLLLGLTQLGGEMSAVHEPSSLELVTGIVAGSNNRVDNNGSCDTYARIGFLPGPHRVGLFFYYSPDSVGDGLHDQMIRVGPDLTLYSRRSKLTAQFLAGHDWNPDGHHVGLWYYGGFLEQTFRVTPELIALLRLDAVGMPGYDDRSAGGNINVRRRVWEVTTGLQYLLLENLKLMAEVTYSETQESVSNQTGSGLTATLRVNTAFWPLNPPYIGNWLGLPPR